MSLAQQMNDGFNDDHGVGWSVLVQTSWSTWDNGYIADSVQRFPDRFIGHGLIDPQDPNNAETARYWMRERGLVGFRLHPIPPTKRSLALTKRSSVGGVGCSRRRYTVPHASR